MQSRACIFALRAVLVGARNLQLTLTRSMFCLASGLRQKCWALQACPMSAQNLARVTLFFPRPLTHTIPRPHHQHPASTYPLPSHHQLPLHRSIPDPTTCTALILLLMAPPGLRSIKDGAADPTETPVLLRRRRPIRDVARPASPRIARPNR